MSVFLWRNAGIFPKDFVKIRGGREPHEFGDFIDAQIGSDEHLFCVIDPNLNDGFVWGDPVFPFQAPYDMDRMKIKIVGNTFQGGLCVEILQDVFHNISSQKLR